MKKSQPTRSCQHPSGLLHRFGRVALCTPRAKSRRLTAAQGGSAAAACLLLALHGPIGLVADARAQSNRATVMEILDRPELYIERRKAQVKDVATEPESVRTQQCRAQLLFAGGAAGRMTSNTVLRLGGTCFQLERGTVLVSGPEGGCTRSVRLSFRGTNYILEALENGDTAVTSLEGPLEVEFLEEGLAKPPVALASGQRLRLYRALGLTTVIDLTPEDYQGIFEGPLFRGFQQRLPDQDALEDYLKANVPGVSLPEPEQPRAVEKPGLPFGFGFGLRFGGGGSRSKPGHSHPERPGLRYR